MKSKIIKRIDLKQQWKNQKKILLPGILNILESGDYVGNKINDTLEKNLAQYCDCKYAVAMNSGTDAITIALHLCGVKKGDEVITHSNSFIATTASIVHLKATPVFVDINQDQTINSDKIEKAITKKTKVILVAHLNGKMNEMRKISKIAKKYKITVVEDCAQSIGSSIYNKKSGSWGKVGCFSTHPLKNLNACGDGGFIVTNKRSFYEKAQKLINHGQEGRGLYNFFAHVSRMDAIQAVILNKRLKFLNNTIRIRRNNAKLYFSNLNQNFVKFNLDDKKKKEFSTFHLFVIRCNFRDKLLKYLKSKNIETGIHYPVPIHKQKAFKLINKQKINLKITEEVSKKILSLPINEYLKKSDILKVCQRINEFYEKKIYRKI